MKEPGQIDFRVRALQQVLRLLKLVVECGSARIVTDEANLLLCIWRDLFEQGVLD